MPFKRGSLDPLNLNIIVNLMLVLIQGNGMRIERSLAFLVNFSFLDAMGRRPNNPGIAILTAGK